MSRFLGFVVLIFIFCGGLTQGQTVSIQGNQNGIIEADTVFLTGNVIINSSDSLVFNAGSVILATGYFRINIEGRIIARGNEINPILFKVSDTTGYSNLNSERGGWDGLHFLNTNPEADSSIFVNCIFSFTKALGDSTEKFGGVFNIRNFNKIRIEKCTFTNNTAWHWGGAIFAESADIKIKSSHFENNSCGQPGPPYGYGGAICIRYSSPEISKSIFLNNRSTGIGGAVSLEYSDVNLNGNLFISNQSGLGGALGYMRSEPEWPVANNIFTQNNSIFFGGAIAFIRSSPAFIHNTLVENSSYSYGGGIYCNDSATPVIVNSIIYNNSAGEGMEVYIWDIYSAPVFLYSDIKGGKEAFGGTGGIGYTAEYNGNIDLEPDLISAEPYYFMLTENSPCIDAGTQNFQTPFYPAFDFSGNQRISGLQPDMGAYEFKSNLGFTNNPKKMIVSCYPNPFNSLIRIDISQALNSLNVIYISSPDGVIVFEKILPAGKNSFQWDGKDSAGKDLSPGIYFVNIVGNENAGINKIIKAF